MTLLQYHPAPVVTSEHKPTFFDRSVVSMVALALALVGAALFATPDDVWLAWLWPYGFLVASVVVVLYRTHMASPLLRPLAGAAAVMTFASRAVAIAVSSIAGDFTTGGARAFIGIVAWLTLAGLTLWVWMRLPPTPHPSRR